MLLKVQRSSVEKMLNRVMLPMRPNQADTQYDLIVRLLRFVAGLDPVHKDGDLFANNGYAYDPSSGFAYNDSGLDPDTNDNDQGPRSTTGNVYISEADIKA